MRKDLKIVKLKQETLLYLADICGKETGKGRALRNQNSFVDVGGNRLPKL